MSNNVLIFDGNWGLHRAWSVIGSKSREPTVRVPHQLLDWFCSYALELNCDAGAMAFDGSENFRYNVYGGYKQDRGGPESSLVSEGPFAGMTSHAAVYASLNPTKALFTSLGIRCIHLKRFEADDVMVSGAWKFGHLKPRNKVILATLDKDMFQSVTKNVFIYHPEMQNRPKNLITPDNIGRGKYGLTPRQFLDYQILVGDKVDSIPPVPGCSSGDALKIIREHGSLSKFFKTPIGQRFYDQRITELHRNKELVMMSKKAFPYTMRDISFKNLQGEASSKAFTELRSRQTKQSLF